MSKKKIQGKHITLIFIAALVLLGLGRLGSIGLGNDSYVGPTGGHGAANTTDDSSSEQTGFTTLEGTPISLDDIEKPAVINSWATWCPFCEKELPDFAAIATEFSEEIDVIAINREEDDSKVVDYIAEQGLADSDIDFWLDPNDSFYGLIGAFSMPETILVDAEGNTLFHQRGAITEAQLRVLVEEHLL